MQVYIANSGYDLHTFSFINRLSSRITMSGGYVKIWFYTVTETVLKTETGAWKTESDIKFYTS